MSFEGNNSQSCGVWDKNYPKACLRGVFSRKVRNAHCAKAFKSVLSVFFLKLSHQYYSCIIQKNVVSLHSVLA